jgi:hypothetical protein
MIGVVALAIVPGDALTSAPLLKSAPSPSSNVSNIEPVRSDSFNRGSVKIA